MITGGEADLLLRFDQARCHQDGRRQMPGIHRTNGVGANEPERVRFDVLLGYSHDRHGPVERKVCVEEGEQAVFVASSGTCGAHQRTRDLDSRPSAGDQRQLGVFQHRHDVVVAALVAQVCTSQD
jgi:hypothetical protein